MVLNQEDTMTERDILQQRAADAYATGIVRLQQLQAPLARAIRRSGRGGRSLPPAKMAQHMASLRALKVKIAEFREAYGLDDPDPKDAGFFIMDDADLSDAEIKALMEARIHKHLSTEISTAINRITGRVD
jgi:hypothetical protein